MPPTRQRAYVVCGNAGVGKSTFAAQLCANKGAVLLDLDTVTERLSRLLLRAHGLSEDDRDSQAYKQLLRDPNYEALFDVACDNLERLPCVIVGPFTRERREPDWPRQLEARLGTQVDVYLIWCSVEQRRERLRQRGNPRDLAKLADFDVYAARGEDPAPLPYPHWRIDTTER